MKKMKYNRRVLCLQECRVNDEPLWSAGLIYRALKHRDGSWSIETNTFGESRVGKGCPLENFEEHFTDITNGADLLDAIRLAYTRGYFKVTDKEGFGCRGIHCETPSGGFYFGGSEADEAESAESYVKDVGALGICQDIASVIASFVESDDGANEEALIYLEEMKDICKVHGTHAIDRAIDEWIVKAGPGQ